MGSHLVDPMWRADLLQAAELTRKHTAMLVTRTLDVFMSVWAP